MSDIIKKTKNIPKPTHYGKNLKYLRRLNGLSQTDLAAKLEINRNNVASYESSMVEPNAKTFLKTCAFFSIDARSMLSTELSQQSVEDLTSINLPESEVSNYLKDQLDVFTKQTNEMTKIYEGYKELIAMRKDTKNEQTGSLYSTLEDLLEVLSSLISSNWKLIQSLYPTSDLEVEN